MTIVPDEAMVEGLREIARSGFDLDTARQVSAARGWKLTDEEPGFLRFRVDPPHPSGEQYLLTVSARPEERRPFAFVTLHYFEEGRDEEPEDIERRPFDRAYRRIAKRLTELLGPIFQSGKYEYPEMEDWFYRYSWWRLEDASLSLVQDEFDIQFGMDISLWVLAKDAEVELPVSE